MRCYVGSSLRPLRLSFAIFAVTSFLPPVKIKLLTAENAENSRRERREELLRNRARDVSDAERDRRADHDPPGPRHVRPEP